MTAGQNIERALPRILEELGTGPVPDYEEAVLQRTAGTRQRPGWAFPSRWLPLAGPVVSPRLTYLPARQLVTLLLLLVALAASLVLYAGSRRPVPPPFGPAANGMIVFGAAGDIVVGDPATGRMTTIVHGPEDDFAPFYSLDGTQVAFLRRAETGLEGAIDLVVARADGSDLRVITDQPMTEIPWVAEWSPDGRTIALVTSPRADAVLLLLETGGRRPPRLVATPVRVDGVGFQPPDGGRILVRLQDGYEVGLYTMTVDGSDLHPLVEPYVPDYDLGWGWQPHAIPNPVDAAGLADLRNSRWSHDGSRVAFQRRGAAEGASGPRLFVIDADGSNLRRVGYTPGDQANVDPSWSPDDRRLAFIRLRDGVFRFVVVDLADGALVETGPPITDGLASLEWSPDATRLLAIEQSGAQRALILDPSGGPWQVMPWTVEGWGDSVMPKADIGAWQRLADP